MKPSAAGNAFEQLLTDLTPRYGAGEARSIARIVFEDVFETHSPASFQLSDTQRARFLDIRQQLLLGKPLQYVLGQADFFGLKFKVNPSVLIPRQETEVLVAWVLDWLKDRPGTTPAILDIGLGSGCIGISIKAKRPDVNLHGLEKSPEALELAIANAIRLLGAGNFSFVCADILDRSCWESFEQLDLIVSNPPYIPHAEKPLMPEYVLAHEPPLALFVADSDPLLFYRTILEFAMEKLKPGGGLFFECNEFNATEVADLLRNANFETVELRKDLSGANRMVTGQVSKSAAT
jgi:release factor glutamine methyltransferase